MKLKSIILRQSKRSSISSRIDLYGIEEYPPHIIKQRNIILYAHQYNLKIFVETGTYHGDMLEVLKNEFGLLYSVELSHDLFLKAKEKFRKTRHIKLIQGDSGVELKKIVKELKKPALFWLDGHYSGGETARGKKDTPILEELITIFGAKEEHIILIDDARLFGSAKDYPSLKELAFFCRNKKPNIDFVVLDDCVRITPKI